MRQFKTSTATGLALAVAALALAACTGVPLSAPPLPAPPPPPVKPAIVWTPRVVPPAPARAAVARAAVSSPARRARLDAAAPPPPPVLHGLQLEPVPEVRVPARFCSLDEKYAFIDGRQLPAYDAAMRNSVAASDYKGELSDLYVQYRDASAGGVHSGEVMAELKRVGPIADAAFTKASAMQRLFDTVMAVPVKGRCKA